MMPLPPPMIVHGTMQEYKLVLERKRAAIQQMCQALEEYLTIDLDTAIQAIENPTKPAPGDTPFVGPIHQIVTDEEFSRICDQIERAERALEDAKRAHSTLGKDGPEGAIRVTIAAQIQNEEDRIEALKRQRDYMQKLMESPSMNSSLPPETTLTETVKEPE